MNSSTPKFRSGRNIEQLMPLINQNDYILKDKEKNRGDTMKKIMSGILILSLMLVIVMISSCASQKSNADTTVPTTPTPDTKTPTINSAEPKAPATTAATTPTTHNVAIKGFKFVPADITIKVGDTIIWTNEDSTAHTATADDGTFDSDRLTKGETFSHTFTAAGKHAYICSIHPSMKGSITVE